MSDSPDPGTRTPLYYTFGNHMHWVDMEWLWGYFVMPSSVRDMLALCQEAGVKGNVNFDGVGYEKLAVEAPDAVLELRQALADGTIDVVGASYGQPYGLFHGGESNIRQRVYGARTVRRLLGVWPNTFWEEEFDFFPQLPQILAGAGFEYASLFFQWTWHTPEVPREKVPAVWWEGQDGSRLLTATRNALNLHQWPEDFAGLLDGEAPRTMPAAGIVQWLELMPSPDWMCRSELILPQLQALQEDSRFELRPVTLREYLEVARDNAEPRRYTLDDVFHGLSLGKNNDQFRELSRAGEEHLLAAEAISTLSGFLGRPYPSWDVYPTWELEEGWRELMIGQHHDNDECEGLMGHIGASFYRKSVDLTNAVLDRTLDHLSASFAGEDGAMLVFNPLGWERDISWLGIDDEAYVVRQVPPFGYRVVGLDQMHLPQPHRVRESGNEITVTRGGMSFTVNRQIGLITQITTPEFRHGVFPEGFGFGRLTCRIGGKECGFTLRSIEMDDVDETGIVGIEFDGPDGAYAVLNVRMMGHCDAVEIDYVAADLPRPDPGFDGALSWTFAANLDNLTLIHDHPYAVSEIEANGSYVRKYPTGDWMTSPQVFETVDNPFSALQFVDMDRGDKGVLFVTGSHQSFQRRGDQVRHLLTLYDPWDENYFPDEASGSLWIVPHGRLMNTGRWKLAQEVLRTARIIDADGSKGSLPSRFSPVWCDSPNIVMTALYRETSQAGEFLTDYAGAGIEYPVIVRLVEFDGRPGRATLKVAGQVATARLAKVRGDRVADLPVRKGKAPARMHEVAEWSEIEVALRPFEIATVYLDAVMARKQTRDLDAHRKVWATVHRRS